MPEAIAHGWQRAVTIKWMWWIKWTTSEPLSIEMSKARDMGWI